MVYLICMNWKIDRILINIVFYVHVHMLLLCRLISVFNVYFMYLL